jgi:hypothetical protein
VSCFRKKATGAAISKCLALPLAAGVYSLWIAGARIALYFAVVKECSLGRIVHQEKRGIIT